MDADVVREVKARRLRLAGHLNSREDTSLLKIVMSRRRPGGVKIKMGSPGFEWTVRMVGADEDIAQDRQEGDKMLVKR